MLKIIISILLLLSHGYTIEYNRDYFTLYDRSGECVADDVAMHNFIVYAEELAD